MSRIVRERLEPGDQIASSTLDDRYNDFTQTDINENNVADGSVDSTQMPNAPTLRQSQVYDIGTGDITFATYTRIGRSTTPLPPAGHVVANSTVALNGTNGYTLESGEVLRVYSTLTCRSMPVMSNFSPHAIGALGSILFRDYTGSPTGEIGIGAHAWRFWLEWDITSSALTTFEPVPGQGDFSALWRSSGLYGQDVNELNGTGFIPLCWAGCTEWSFGDPALTFRKEQNTGWRTATISFVYEKPSGSVTVYGLRLVVQGLYHPYNDSGFNGMVYDPSSTFGAGASIDLDYGPGSILAMHMRSE
jgi:hypothetical protein